MSRAGKYSTCGKQFRATTPSQAKYLLYNALICNCKAGHRRVHGHASADTDSAAQAACPGSFQVSPPITIYHAAEIDLCYERFLATLAVDMLTAKYYCMQHV